MVKHLTAILNDLQIRVVYHFVIMTKYLYAIPIYPIADSLDLHLKFFLTLECILYSFYGFCVTIDKRLKCNAYCGQFGIALKCFTKVKL